MKKFLAIFLILSGISMILYTPLQDLYAEYNQNKLIKMYEDTHVEISEPEQQEIADFYRYYQELQMKTEYVSDKNKNYASLKSDKDIIGIISIEKINLKLPVKNSFIESEIKSSVGHLLGTAYPGEQGNCVIAGHRCFTKGKLFNRLDELEIGDSISINYNSSSFNYKVYDIQIVEPSDISVLNAVDDEISLTLITCHPYKLNTHRLIVKAAMYH